MFLFPHTLTFYLPAFLFIISLPFSLPFYLPDSNPLSNLNNQVREVLLYTGITTLSSAVQTICKEDPSLDVSVFPGVMELKSINPGNVVIKGRSAALFLCMDSEGHLRGQVRQYVEADCTFRELLLADGYTRFLSSHHGVPVSLASKHSPDRHAVPFTRFLPLRNTLAGESVIQQPSSEEIDWMLMKVGAPSSGQMSNY
uniref:Fibroblast growth factor 21 n=1 Tax=Labrus bergylta TaxID=56723 RepID=A0A3Q3GS46_9LABR